MILLDANIFMYTVGRDHPYKEASAAFLQLAAEKKMNVAVDAEVLQEILHRYRRTGEWEKGRIAYDSARAVVPTVISITVDHTDEARLLLDRYPHLTARDAVHAAVCLEEGATLCSYDRDFDGIVGITRHEPGKYLT